MAKKSKTDQVLADAAAQQEIKARTDAHRSKVELSTTKQRERELMHRVAELEDLLAVATHMGQYSNERQSLPIITREKGTAHEGTAVLLFSDVHPEEVVKAESVNGLNDFNPGVAQARVTRLIEGFRWYLETVRSAKGEAGYKVRDMMLVLGGDMISNTIHPDLAESVAMGPADAITLAFELCCQVIDGVLEDKQLERIVVPCLMGNHDRLTPKIRHQTRSGTSLATILYYFLKHHYQSNPRLSFDIARSNMTYTPVYGKEIRSTHGDDVRFGGGVGGVHIPLQKAIMRWNRNRVAAYTNVHHFHTELWGQDYIVNGSVIGYTAYSQNCGFPFAPAAQVTYILDPKRGRRFGFPIQLQDCAAHWS